MMPLGDWPGDGFNIPAAAPPVLDPDTARALLRECVTIVNPGETVVVRVPETWTPLQAEWYQEYADAARECGRISFPVLVVLGGELAVVKPKGDPARWLEDVHTTESFSGNERTVRMTHLPSGISATAPTKERATRILAWDVAVWLGGETSDEYVAMGLPPLNMFSGGTDSPPSA